MFGLMVLDCGWPTTGLETVERQSTGHPESEKKRIERGSMANTLGLGTQYAVWLSVTLYWHLSCSEVCPLSSSKLSAGIRLSNPRGNNPDEDLEFGIDGAEVEMRRSPTSEEAHCSLIRMIK